jgi:hypothetical protein
MYKVIFKKFYDSLFREVDIASLAFFRIAFGAFMFYEVYHYIETGWAWDYFVFPRFYFTYPGFHWIEPLSNNGMINLFLVMGVLSVFVLIGFLYRVSIFLFTLAFTYLFLIDASNYLNHFYLISLLGFLLSIIPTHRNYSVDAALRPSIKSNTLPAWCLWLLLFQIGIPFVFGGIGKMNSDWLNGEPMRLWLSEIPDFPVIGQYFEEEWLVFFMSRAGLALDFFIIGFLLFRPTRWLAFIAGVLFHVMNAHLWSIGIFPWFMIVATTLFFDPAWPKKLLHKITFKLPDYPLIQKRKIGFWNGSKGKKIIVGFLMVYCAGQIIVPFRHHLITGNTHWTEEGHMFSWHMKLRDKRSSIAFFVRNNETRIENEIEVLKFLTVRQANFMSTQPYYIWQFAQKMKEYYRQEGTEDVSINALVMTSLNNRKPQLLIDSELDLAALEAYHTPAPWIQPLITPLIIPIPKQNLSKKLPSIDTTINKTVDK